MDINSDVGRLVLFAGFFIFVGMALGLVLAGISAQRAYKRGLTWMNPLGCTAVAFVVLVLAALIRSCAEGA